MCARTPGTVRAAGAVSCCQRRGHPLPVVLPACLMTYARRAAVSGERRAASREPRAAGHPLQEPDSSARAGNSLLRAGEQRAAAAVGRDGRVAVVTAKPLFNV